MKIEVVQKGIIKEEIKFPALMTRENSVVLFTGLTEGYAIQNGLTKPFFFRDDWMPIEEWSPFKGTITITCD